jgi:hypothetical protein
MTLDQIDRLLEQWRGKLSMAAQNLVDLRSHPTYLELGSRTDLTGVTLARVEPMLASMVNLFDYYEKLQACIGRAEDARKSITRLFTSPEKIDEVARILNTRSIQLPPVDIPLGQRDLVSPNNTLVKISPEELLAKLTQGFGDAKEVVLRVDAAWRLLGSQLDDVEREVAGLQARIAGARQLIATDPLGAQEETEALTQLAARRIGLTEELRRAAQTLAAVNAAHAGAAQSFEEANHKIQNAPNLRPPCQPAAISALDTWLKALNVKMDEGAWDAVAVGIDSWKQNAAHCLQSEVDAAEVNQKPVQLRRELRGRLDALKAKAVAKGKSEDGELARIGKEARTLLQTNPTSLAQAEQILREYEKRLSLLLGQ